MEIALFGMASVKRSLGICNSDIELELKEI